MPPPPIKKSMQHAWYQEVIHNAVNHICLKTYFPQSQANILFWFIIINLISLCISQGHILPNMFSDLQFHNFLHKNIHF